MKAYGFSIIMLAAMLSGCTIGTNYQMPQAELPAGWSKRQSAEEVVVTGREPSVALGSWWTSFGDPVLDKLIAEATAANHDLRIARGRLLEARARLRGASANQAPMLGASGKAVHQRTSANGPQGHIPGAKFEGELYEAGFDASWELDVFGFVRRGVDVAAADVQAAEELVRDVLVTLLAEVGRDYIELRSLQQRLAIVQQNLESQQDTLSLLSVRFEAGLAADLDVVRAEAQLSATRAQIPAFEAQIEQMIYRLATLTGKAPASLLPELGNPVPLSERAVAAGVPLGLPSDLLRRRPDIRAAERQLAVATLRKGVAQADLYPHFFLTGAAGLQSLDSGDFFTASSRVFSIGPTVRWSVFDFGRVRANIAVQDARVEQLLAAYEKSILTALGDVESALAGLDKEVVRQQALAVAVTANRRAVTSALDLYQQGLTTYLSVLDSQRQALQSEDQLAQSRAFVLLNRVSLYKALGGGWME